MNAAKLFEGVPDHATLRLVPVEGGLPEEHRMPVLAVLRELLAGWKESGAIRSGGVELLADGSFIGIAWDPGAGDLSGCTKDGLAHVLQSMEQHVGRRMLNAPRLAVALEGTTRFLSPPEFRQLAIEGTITPQAAVYDHLLTTVGDLRAGKFATTVGASWYARLMPQS